MLNVPILPNDDIINPPLSWIQVAMKANLVDEHHNVKANLLDAVKRGFNALQYDFLDEKVGTDNKE